MIEALNKFNEWIGPYEEGLTEAEICLLRKFFFDNDKEARCNFIHAECRSQAAIEVSKMLTNETLKRPNGMPKLKYERNLRIALDVNKLINLNMLCPELNEQPLKPVKAYKEVSKLYRQVTDEIAKKSYNEYKEEIKKLNLLLIMERMQLGHIIPLYGNDGNLITWVNLPEPVHYPSFLKSYNDQNAGLFMTMLQEAEKIGYEPLIIATLSAITPRYLKKAPQAVILPLFYARRGV